jgi:hypothetical protein
VRRARARAHAQLTAAMLLGLLLGVIGSGWHVLSLARLFTWRLSIPLFALLLMAAGATLRRLWRERAWSGLVWWLAGCASLLTFAQSDPLEPSPWNHAPLAAAIALPVFALATGALLLASRRRQLLLWCAPLAALAVLALAWSVVLTPHWQADGQPWQAPPGLHWLDARIQLTPRVGSLYALVRERTPVDARFLIPPGLSQFRMQARRAVFVDWKCAPMNGAEALEWQRRMLLAMGTSTFPARGYELPRAADAAYNARPLTELAELARTAGLTHLLVRERREPEPAGVRRVFGHRGYVVYELAPVGR